MRDTSIATENECEDNMRRVSDRTLELARLAGRAPHELRQADYERAKREIACDRPTGLM